MSAMEAAEARLNEEERAAAEAGASQDMRLRPVIGAVDVFEEDEDEEVPPKDVGRCAHWGGSGPRAWCRSKIFVADGARLSIRLLCKSLACGLLDAVHRSLPTFVRQVCTVRYLLRSLPPARASRLTCCASAWLQGAQHAAGVPAGGAVPPDPGHLGGHLRLGVPGPRDGASRQGRRPQKGAKSRYTANVAS